MHKQMLSFIIPIYNEAESIDELYKKITDVLAKKLPQYNCEIIFINDGSSDTSLIFLKDLHRNDARVKIISFRKNLGKAAGLNEGFKRAAGDVIVTLDGDLQDGPENIPLLLDKLEDGFDMVVGWKQKRHDSVDKTVPSKIFNTVVSKLAKLPLHDMNSGLKVMKKPVAKELYLYAENHRFIPVLAAQRGFTITEVAVTHYPRKYGKSKYGWERLLNGFFDFLTVLFIGTYGHRPLHLFGMLGAIAIFIGILLGSYLSLLRFMGESIGRRPLLLLAVLLIIVGLQSFSLGLIAEMIVSKVRSDDTVPIDYET